MESKFYKHVLFPFNVWNHKKLKETKETGRCRLQVIASQNIYSGLCLLSWNCHSTIKSRYGVQNSGQQMSFKDIFKILHENPHGATVRSTSRGTYPDHSPHQTSDSLWFCSTPNVLTVSACKHVYFICLAMLHDRCQPSWKQLGTVLAFTRYSRLTWNQLASRFWIKYWSLLGPFVAWEGLVIDLHTICLYFWRNPNMSINRFEEPFTLTNPKTAVERFAILLRIR
jgi:hypothetical protein